MCVHTVLYVAKLMKARASCRFYIRSYVLRVCERETCKRAQEGLNERVMESERVLRDTGMLVKGDMTIRSDESFFFCVIFQRSCKPVSYYCDGFTSVVS